jgi:hypothetical protein
LAALALRRLGALRADFALPLPEPFATTGDGGRRQARSLAEPSRDLGDHFGIRARGEDSGLRGKVIRRGAFGMDLLCDDEAFSRLRVWPVEDRSDD